MTISNDSFISRHITASDGVRLTASLFRLFFAVLGEENVEHTKKGRKRNKIESSFRVFPKKHEKVAAFTAVEITF
jgi:hypothetical protein